jgi:hypothetical protein
VNSDLKAGRGVLVSDTALVNSEASPIMWLLDGFARDQGGFHHQFGESMKKLGKMSWRTNKDGEIGRVNCFRTNSGRFLDTQDDLAADA